jgi:hypothetical protein
MRFAMPTRPDLCILLNLAVPVLCNKTGIANSNTCMFIAGQNIINPQNVFDNLPYQCWYLQTATFGMWQSQQQQPCASTAVFEFAVQFANYNIWQCKFTNTNIV